MLTRADVEEIMRLLDQSDFQDLRLEHGDLKLELRRKGAMPPAPAAPVSAVPMPAHVTGLQPAPFASVAAPVIASGGGAEVPAPLLGTFWHAPRPGADPFVKVGDVVAPDTVIGIIEVMKLMTSVPAGLAGVVAEILVPNGQMVEHGQALIRVAQG